MISVRARFIMRAAALLLFLLAQVAVWAQSVTTLHSFDDTDGGYPSANVIQASDGNFYGTTESGGTYGYGTIFQLTPSGTLTTLHSFNYSTDGGDPYFDGLIQASDGNLYGMTYVGGAYGFGTVFQITLGGTLTTLHSFDYYTDGGYPVGSLIQASNGNLYGTAEEGGASDYGTVFQITLAGTFTTLHSFVGYPSDGGYPLDSLIQASDGNLYGTTYYGGAYGFGTVFQITLGGSLTTLHSFDYFTDGGNPFAGLIQASDGNLYGTTELGGADYYGTVFQITLAGTFTTLHSFVGYPSDGGNPVGSLIQASDGNLYGTAEDGGANYYGYGTVFQITLGGSLTTLHSFDNTDGSLPFGGLIQASDGNLYGTTQEGGANGYGTVFSFSLPSLPPVHTAANDSYQVNENTTLNVNAAYGVLTNDANTGGGILTAYLVSSTSNGSLTLNADGSFTYTPDPGFVGTDSFTYFNNDGQANSNTVTVTIQVNATGGTIKTSVYVTNTVCNGAGPCTLYARLVKGTAVSSSAYLAGQTLTFLVNGVTVGTGVTDAYGKAGVTFMPTMTGVLPITVQFAGSGPYLPSSGAGSLAVNAAATTVTVNAATGQAGHRIGLRGSLTQTVGGSGLVGQTVTVLVDGNVVGTPTTGRFGVFGVDYLIPANTALGMHTITATFAGTALDMASSGGNTLTVTP